MYDHRQTSVIQGCCTTVKMTVAMIADLVNLEELTFLIEGMREGDGDHGKQLALG